MLRPIGKAVSFAKIAAIVIFLILKGLLRANLRRLFNAIGRLAAKAVKALAGFLVDVLRALIKPTLTLAGLFALFAVVSSMKPLEPTSAPAAMLAIPAPPGKSTPAPSTVIKPPEPKTSLARFHANEQTFKSDASSIAALADALNIPDHVVKSNLTRALELAESNADAMRPHVGRFPLPETTSNRLLSALTPSDVDHLRMLLDYASTRGRKHFSLNAAMPSGELTLEAKVTELDRGCFRYAMTFVRRSFRHTAIATACRKGTAWSFPEKRSTP